MKKHSLTHGFSLVETLVAIGILSLSIAAAFASVQSGLQASTGAKDQIIAFYLAQEGMEYIKNIRDENALNSINGGANTWLTGISAVANDPCYFGNVCSIDSPAKTVASCGAAAITTSPPNLCPVLNQDSATGLYGYNALWTPTRFKREIQLRSISASEVEVVITISWNARGLTKYFQVSERLFNRQ